MLIIFALAPNPLLAGAALLLTGVAVRVAFRRDSQGADLSGATFLAGTFMLLVSPHYPWYFTWLVAFACFVRPAAFVWLTLASLLLYLLPAWPQAAWDRQRTIIESLIYLPFLLLAAFEFWRQSHREHARDDERTLG